jgi:hypothetical protein
MKVRTVEFMVLNTSHIYQSLLRQNEVRAFPFCEGDKKMTLHLGIFEVAKGGCAQSCSKAIGLPTARAAITEIKHLLWEMLCFVLYIHRQHSS